MLQRKFWRRLELVMIEMIWSANTILTTKSMNNMKVKKEITLTELAKYVEEKYPCLV